MKILANRRIVFLLLFVITLISYWGLQELFFQQDEWIAWGQAFALGYGFLTHDISRLGVFFGEGRPLARMLSVFFAENYYFNTFPIAVFSFFFHLANVYLVYLLTRKITKNFILSFIVALFFATNSVHHQAVSWFGGSIGVLPAVFFTLLSLYLFKCYQDNHIRVYVLSSFLTAVLSLYFKEIGFFLFIFIPLIALIDKMYDKKKEKWSIRQLTVHIKEVIGIYWYFFLFLVCFIAYRTFTLFLLPQGNILNSPLYVSGTSLDSLLTIVYHTFYYPLTSFSLNYFPPSRMIHNADIFTRLYYTSLVKSDYFPVIIHGVALDVLALTLSFLFFIILYFIWKKLGKKQYFVIYALLLFGFSIFPYIFINKATAYLEHRYYYLITFPSGLLLGVVVYFIYEKVQKNKPLLIILFLVLVGFFVGHIQEIQKDIKLQASLSIERKSILSQLEKIRPNIANQTVFYLSGNRNYVMDKNPLPFQQGIGYTLMTFYYPKGNIHKNYLTSYFLMDLGSEGYKNIDNYGFGYFYTEKKFREAVSKYNIPKKNIIYIYYDGNGKKLYEKKI